MKKLVTFIITVLACFMLTTCGIFEQKEDSLDNKWYQFPVVLNATKKDVVWVIWEKDGESPLDNSFEWYPRNGFVIKYDSYGRVDKITIHNWFNSDEAKPYQGYIYNNVKFGDNIQTIISKLWKWFTFESEEKTWVYDRYTWILDWIRIIVDVEEWFSRSIEIQKGY